MFAFVSLLIVSLVCDATAQDRSFALSIPLDAFLLFFQAFYHKRRLCSAARFYPKIVLNH